MTQKLPTAPLTWPSCGQVWADAAQDAIFSLSLCLGVLTNLGSYNKYNRDFHRDCLILCGLNLATILFISCIVYCITGYLAEIYQADIDEFASAGVYYIFEVVPAFLTRMPGSNIWAGLFFLLIFFLGIDTQFMFTETLATAIIDTFPRQLRKPKRREVLVLVIVVVSFLLGLVFVTQGGFAVFMLVDTFGCSLIVSVCLAALESIVIGWVYGADRFYDNLEDMLGYRPIPLYKYCWMFVCPFICWMLLLRHMYSDEFVYLGNYVVAALARAFGAILMVVPLLCIPVFVLVALWKEPQSMASPSRDLRQAKPHKAVLTLCKCVVFGAQAPPKSVAEHANEKMMMEEADGGV